MNEGVETFERSPSLDLYPSFKPKNALFNRPYAKECKSPLEGVTIPMP